MSPVKDTKPFYSAYPGVKFFDIVVIISCNAAQVFYPGTTNWHKLEGTVPGGVGF